MITPIGAVFSGAGTLGSSEVGAAQAVEDCNMGIKILVTTSAGSIIGALLALGRKAKDLKTITEDADYKKLIPFNFFSYSKFIFMGHMVSNDNVIEWLKTITDNAKAKDLIMPLKTVTTDLQSGKSMVFDSVSNPNMYVWEMVLPSMSIPDVFPTYLKKYVDGGVADNLGINFLETKYRKIAFRVYSPLKPKLKFNLISKQIRLVNIMLSSDENLLALLGKDLGVEVINLPVVDNLTFLEPGMTLPQKLKLYDAGYKAAFKYLSGENK